jgi:hypothetical protein
MVASVEHEGDVGQVRPGFKADSFLALRRSFGTPQCVPLTVSASAPVVQIEGLQRSERASDSFPLRTALLPRKVVNRITAVSLSGHRLC